MKKLLFALSFLIISHASGAQNIQFAEGTFAEIMATAKAQKKVVFVDFYTDWCGPCKTMAAKTFTDENVAFIFNETFISYKIDAEKGEGNELRQRYKVSSYPTYLWLDAKGDVVHRATGNMPPKNFVGEVMPLLDKAALEKKKPGVFTFAEPVAEVKEKAEPETFEYQILLRAIPHMDQFDWVLPEASARYLLVAPKEKLMSHKYEDMSMHARMMGSLKEFDRDVMYRLMDVCIAKRDPQGNFPKEHWGANFSIQFLNPAEMVTNKFMHEAIKAGDEKTLEELIKFKLEWEEKVSDRNKEEGDIGLYTLRGVERLVFASPEYIRLEFMKKNGRADQFRAALPVYMDKLMAQYPVDKLPPLATFSFGDIENKLKENARNADFILSGYVEARDLSQDTYLAWIEYYWFTSPSDKRTKDTVAKWLNYVCDLNKYRTEGVKQAARLLVQVGHKADALKQLERLLGIYKGAASYRPEWIEGVEELIAAVKNNKIG